MYNYNNEMIWMFNHKEVYSQWKYIIIVLKIKLFLLIIAYIEINYAIIILIT